jgi:hypothetical protein
MIRRFSSARRLRLLVAVVGAVLIALLLAPLALADGPITWAPADSTYGVSDTAFATVPMAPPGVGMTQPGLPVMYGAGFWDASSEVFAMGFVNAIPAGTGLPTMAQTDLLMSALAPGTPLKLAFDKAAGQRIDSVAILGDPDALVSIEPADAAALTAATRFTVYASVTDPVASASGDVAAAFGLVVDCSSLAARDYQGSTFVTNMHWLDIDPPTFTATGMAGLSAHGVNGTEATFDGIFAPAFLTVMGIADPAQVQGFVDLTAYTGWASSTFTVMGSGDGSLWPSGYYKYRITNSTWSTHNIMFGRLAKPGKPTVISPKGLITGTRPTFRWKSVRLAKAYEVRVYKGARLLLKKTGATALSWRASKALPRGVYLTWKVRASSASGSGVWSTALKFKVR